MTRRLRLLWPATTFALLVVNHVVVPEAVEASTFKSARMEVGDSDVTLYLEANGRIGTSSVRSEPGQIRIWFDGLGDDVRLDPPVSYDGLRFVRIRPGFGQTMVVLLRVADRRTVDPAIVQVLSDGSRAFVRIPLDALPSVAPAPVVEETPAPEAVDAEAEPAAVEHEAASVTPEADEVAGKASTPESGAGLPTKDNRLRGKSGSGSSVVWVMLLVTALLGATYGVLRLIVGKRKKSPLDDIQIVAQKRLGTRHQIVLVRALGEDHLLSVNGQQTQRIASTTSVEPGATDDIDESVLNAGLFGTLLGNGSASEEEDVQTMPTVAPQRPAPAVRKEERSVVPDLESRAVPAPVRDRRPQSQIDGLSARLSSRRPMPVRVPEKEENKPSRFGSELFRMALENEARPPITVRPPKGRANESEAVAGLLKLRDRLAAS